MINYDSLRADVPVSRIMRDIEHARRLLFECEGRDGFVVRRLDGDDIRSLKASVDVGLAMLKKVMPDLKAEDMNTIAGRDRLSFLAELRARMLNPDISETERRVFQLTEILKATAEQRITIDEAGKLQKMLDPGTDDNKDAPVAIIPISDTELRNRLIHYDSIH